MFVTEETTLGLPLGRAVAQLGSAIESGWFGEVSDHAYAAGLAVLTRAGPPGDVRGLAKTGQVRLSGPRERVTGVAYALRWVATGPAGGLFPALDADMSLTRVDASRTRLAIIACYRPPPGTLGVQLDRLLLSRVARATLRSLLDTLAQEMTQPARTLAPTGAVGPVRPVRRYAEVEPPSVRPKGFLKYLAERPVVCRSTSPTALGQVPGDHDPARRGIPAQLTPSSRPEKVADHIGCRVVDAVAVQQVREET